MNVWGVGLIKTGVTSLAKALNLLGFNAKKIVIPKELTIYEAGTDMPVAARYKALDEKHPGSKFILTLRHTEGVECLDDWLESCRLQWRRAKFPGLAQNKPFVALEISYYRTFFFGGYDYDRATFIRAYWQHYADVLAYFDTRRTDLLVLNIFNGDPWPPLCKFLGKPVPNIPFPHLNKARSR